MYNLIGQKQLTCTSSQSTLNSPCQSVSDCTPCQSSCKVLHLPSRLDLIVTFCASKCQIIHSVSCYLLLLFVPVPGFILLGSDILNTWPVYEVLSWLTDDADIWARCIKMVPSKFDVFTSLIFFFYISLHQHKVSKLQRDVLPDGTEVTMRRGFIC